MQIWGVIYLRIFLNDGNRKSIFFSISAVAFKNAKQFEQAKDACLREARDQTCVLMDTSWVCYH